jgi:hypothetical protein
LASPLLHGRARYVEPIAGGPRFAPMQRGGCWFRDDMADPIDDRAPYRTARAARFAKTAAAAASSRPAPDDEVPWTHAPARDPDQGRSALGRWLRCWLGLGASGNDGAGERASAGGARRPEVRSTRRRPRVPEVAVPGSETAGALAQIVPRRPGARTRAHPATGGDPGEDRADDPRLAQGGPGTAGLGGPMIRPTRQVGDTADRVVRPGRPQHRRPFGGG